MTKVVRNRQFEDLKSQTSLYYLADGETKHYNVSISGEQVVIDDVIGNRHGENPFALSRTIVNPVVSDYVAGLSTGRREIYANSAPNHLSIPEADNGSLATLVAARTNPSRASLLSPVSILELKDLPRMFKTIRDIVHRGTRKRKLDTTIIPDSYLSFEFGWKPMVSDMLKVIQLGSALDNRMADVNRLFDKGGLSRKRELSTGSKQSIQKDKLLQSYLMNVRGDLTINTTTKVWGSCKWVPSSRLRRLDPANRRKLVAKHLKGIDVTQMSTNAWNALPWSWLIDWVTDVGDYLVASNNSIAMRRGPVCIMRHTESENSYSNITTGSTVITDPYPDSPSIRENKVRSLAYPSLINSKLPILSVRQLSILGSLKWTRNRSASHLYIL